MWGLPWGLGVHGDHHALKKKRQGDPGSARHGLTKAINPSPRGPRDPRTWEGEIQILEEKEIRDCNGSRQGPVEPRSCVNCTAPALPRRPRGGPSARRRKRNRRRKKKKMRQRRSRKAKRRPPKKKTHFASTRERGARGTPHDDVAGARPRPCPASPMHGFHFSQSEKSTRRDFTSCTRSRRPRRPWPPPRPRGPRRAPWWPVGAQRLAAKQLGGRTTTESFGRD